MVKFYYNQYLSYFLTEWPEIGNSLGVRVLRDYVFTYTKLGRVNNLHRVKFHYSSYLIFLAKLPDFFWFFLFFRIYEIFKYIHEIEPNGMTRGAMVFCTWLASDITVYNFLETEISWNELFNTGLACTYLLRELFPFKITDKYCQKMACL